LEAAHEGRLQDVFGRLARFHATFQKRQELPMAGYQPFYRLGAHETQPNMR
jgi:hypothetical protein